MFDQITGIISLLSNGVKLLKDSMDVVTSIRGSFSTHSAEKLKENVYYTPEQEVFNSSIKRQEYVDHRPIILNSINPIQDIIKTDLLITQPIVTPDKFKQAMTDNPKDLLFNIVELDSWTKTKEIIDDPTLIPIVFPDGHKHYVGWIKKGYAKDYLSLDYKPKNELTAKRSSRLNLNKPKVEIRSFEYDRKSLITLDVELINFKGITCNLDLIISNGEMGNGTDDYKINADSATLNLKFYNPSMPSLLRRNAIAKVRLNNKSFSSSSAGNIGYDKNYYSETVRVFPKE
jgi:hypothetical protein